MSNSISSNYLKYSSFANERTKIINFNWKASNKKEIKKEEKQGM